MELINLRLVAMISPPFISFFVYYLSKLIVKHKRRAFHIMIAWTTIFYIVVASWLLEEIISYNVIGMTPVVLLLLLSIILIIQWRIRTEVVLRNGLKILWRLLFLIFIPIYFCLLIYQLIIEFS